MLYGGGVWWWCMVVVVIGSDGSDGDGIWCW